MSDDTSRKVAPSRSSLPADLQALGPDLRARLEAAGFERRRAYLPGSHPDGGYRDATRHAEPVGGDRSGAGRLGIVDAPAPGTAEAERLRALGLSALARGELAFVVMAGGMATRMGGVVKALVEATPGKTFLELRLAENTALGKLAGRSVPLWLMTSDATDAPTREALARARAPGHVKTFLQGLSLKNSPRTVSGRAMASLAPTRPVTGTSSTRSVGPGCSMPSVAMAARSSGSPTSTILALLWTRRSWGRFCRRPPRS